MTPEKTMDRLANASFYVKGSVKDLAESVQVDSSVGDKNLLAAAGTLLAKYRENDGKEYGEDRVLA